MAGFVGASACIFIFTGIDDPRRAMIVLGFAGFFNDFVMPAAWAGTMDIGGRYSGTVSGAMNMMGSIAGAVSVTVVGYLVAWSGGDWTMDDQALYFSNWLHGDLRRYDVSDPADPKLTGRLWLGGVLGHPNDAGRELNGGPQMLQLSLDGKRLYVTNSLYSTWDNQFYPELRSWLLKVDIGEDGSMAIDRDFFVHLHDRPGGPARAHEVRLQGGDCTTEIFQ